MAICRGQIKEILILVTGRTEYRFLVQLKNFYNLSNVIIKFAPIKKIIRFFNGEFLEKKYRKYAEVHIIYDKEGIYFENHHKKDEDTLIETIEDLQKKRKINKELEYQLNIDCLYTKILLIPSNPSFELIFYLILKNSGKTFNTSKEIEDELSKISKLKYDKKGKLNQNWLDKNIFNHKKLENLLKESILRAKEGFKNGNSSCTLVFKTIKQILINAKRYK